MTLCLTHSTLDPHSRKTRLLLAECELPFVLEEEEFWKRNEDFIQLNPAGEVPVLQDENGAVIAGHYAISEYCEERSQNTGKPSLLGNTLELRAETRRLTDWFDSKFYREITQILVYEKYFKRLESKGWPDTKAFRACCKQVHYHLDMIEALTQESPWLNGESISLADYAAAAQISVIDYFGDIDWKDHNKARDWYRLMKSRPSMRKILAERVRGVTPPDHYDNPDF